MSKVNKEPDMKSFQKKIVFFVYAAIFKITLATDLQLLVVSNDGPATLDSNITFTALLKDYRPKKSLTYVFSDGIQSANFSSLNNNLTLTFVFMQEFYKEGDYDMNVTVYLGKEVVAYSSNRFSLKSELIGDLLVYRENATISTDDEVAVGENVTFKLKLRDRSGYLKLADMSYGWSIDMERIPNALENVTVFNFTDPGIKEVKAVATALFKNNIFKYGSFKKTVSVKVPVNNVNVSGNPFLHHGDLLHLNVSCNGTPPFSYCSEILEENTTIENFTCNQPTTFTTCHMMIQKFLVDGKYNMGIYISNDVKEVKRIIEVVVFNVSIQPTLSTVIIPIVCSLLTLVIIALGISFYIQQRKKLTVEVANFDFHEDSDSYTERTFFEKIFDSFTCKSCARNRLSSRTESDPLLSDDYEPIV